MSFGGRVESQVLDNDDEDRGYGERERSSQVVLHECHAHNVD